MGERRHVIGRHRRSMARSGNRFVFLRFEGIRSGSQSAAVGTCSQRVCLRDMHRHRAGPNLPMGATHNNLQRPAPGDVANCFGCLRFAGNRTPNGEALGIPDVAITCGTGRITGMQGHCFSFVDFAQVACIGTFPCSVPCLPPPQLMAHDMARDRRIKPAARARNMPRTAWNQYQRD